MVYMNKEMKLHLKINTGLIHSYRAIWVQLNVLVKYTLFVLGVKIINVVLSAFSFLPLSQNHFWTASKYKCNSLQSATWLIIRKNLKSSAYKTQLELQSESQTALKYTLNNKGPKIHPYRTQDVLLHKWKTEKVRNCKWCLH